MIDQTILLVEDEPNSVFLLQHVLKRAGIANPVYVAKDGREALDYLEGIGPFADRGTHPLPALVLLDLKLPRADGFEVLERIRKRPDTQKLIVLILTSSASDDDIARAYALGTNAYLVKPLRLEKLEEMVRAIKDFWLVQNHPAPLAP